MQDITFQCEHCGQSLSIEEDCAGLAIDCPACNKQITVPSLQNPKESQRQKLRINKRSETFAPPGQETPPKTEDDPIPSSTTTEVHSATCSNCGAQLDIDENTETATCLFCGSKSLVNTPQDRLDRLRDIESPSLGVTHFTPSISFDQARQLILAKIKADECSLKNADSLQIAAKGFYYPAWKIDVNGQCCWSGANSRQEPFTNYRTVYDRVGDRTIERKEPFVDHKTVWDHVSGQKYFSSSLLLPAGEGISPTQFDTVSMGTDGETRYGHPARSNRFIVIPATKPQSRVWNEYDAESRVYIDGRIACMGCAERIDDVSVSVQSRNFSLTYIPVAVVTYKANDTEYRHFVNLQTGHFSGDVPLDLSKVANEGARATKEDEELKLTKIIAWSALGLYILVTCLLNMAWRDWDPIEATASGVAQPFLAIFGENLEKGDLLAGGHVLSIIFSWVGWLVAFGLYIMFVPAGSPWLAFLAKRQAFLLRLTLSPPQQLATLAVFNDPRLSEGRKVIQKAADENTLDILPFENTKPVIEVVANALLETAPQTPTTQRFIGTMVCIGCYGLVLLIAALSYSSAVTGIRRAEQLAVIEKQRQEQVAQEEQKRQDLLAQEEQKRQECAAKEQQAKEDAERKRLAESARQMLSVSRWNDGAFGVSYSPPRGWRRSRSSADSMSSWFGNGYPLQPNMNFRIIRNDSYSLERAAENGLSATTDAIREMGGSVKSLGTFEFKTTTGKSGMRLLVHATTKEGSFRQALFYIANGQTLLLGICTSQSSQWDTFGPMYDVCMQSVQFGTTMATPPDNLDTTPELNADMSDGDALLNIGLTYYYDGNQQKAFSFFQKAADKGNIVAQYNVGVCYMDGVGAEKDAFEAVKWYKLSGQRGSAMAQVKLGICYYRGVGVAKNLDSAETCFRLAAQQGDIDGRKLLDAILAEKANAQQQQTYSQYSKRTYQNNNNESDDTPKQSHQPSGNASFRTRQSSGSSSSGKVRRIGESDQNIRRIGE